MPTFDDATTTTAPVEEVWKLLYDPARLIEWWEGIERIETHGTDGKGNVTIWPDGYPDFPMPQNLRTDADGKRVTVAVNLKKVKRGKADDPVLLKDDLVLVPESFF